MLSEEEKSTLGVCARMCACVRVGQGIPISNNPFWRRVKTRSIQKHTRTNGRSLFSVGSTRRRAEERQERGHQRDRGMDRPHRLQRRASSVSCPLFSLLSHFLFFPLPFLVQQSLLKVGILLQLCQRFIYSTILSLHFLKSSNSLNLTAYNPFSFHLTSVIEFTSIF